MKMFKTAAAVMTMTALTACSGGDEAPEADASTETQMDEVDVIDGTISDDMVDVDAQATGDELAGDGAENGEETEASE